MVSKNVLVTGASGFIGWPLYCSLKKNFNPTGTFHEHRRPGLVAIDLTDGKKVSGLIHKTSPDIIIHSAAVTNVDLCERNPPLAQSLHVDATRNLVNACQKQKIRLILFSTDFVFDGKKGNYSETDAPQPMNVYGKTKLAAEQLVQSLDESAIIRLSTPYSEKGGIQKFVGQTIEKLSQGKKVTAFSDWVRSPTLVENLIENTVRVIEKNFSGTIHLSGANPISMFDAARQIADVLKVSPSLVEAVSSRTMVFDAPRPLNTGLNTSLAKENNFSLLSFREGLERVQHYNAIRP